MTEIDKDGWKTRPSTAQAEECASLPTSRRFTTIEPTIFPLCIDPVNTPACDHCTLSLPFPLARPGQDRSCVLEGGRGQPTLYNWWPITPCAFVLLRLVSATFRIDYISSSHHHHGSTMAVPQSLLDVGVLEFENSSRGRRVVTLGPSLAGVKLDSATFGGHECQSPSLRNRGTKWRYVVPSLENTKGQPPRTQQRIPVSSDVSIPLDQLSNPRTRQNLPSSRSTREPIGRY